MNRPHHYASPNLQFDLLVDMASDYVTSGTKSFSDFVRQVVTSMGLDRAIELQQELQNAWNLVRKSHPNIDVGQDIHTILERMQQRLSQINEPPRPDVMPSPKEAEAERADAGFENKVKPVVGLDEQQSKLAWIPSLCGEFRNRYLNRALLIGALTAITVGAMWVAGRLLSPNRYTMANAGSGVVYKLDRRTGEMWRVFPNGKQMQIDIDE